MGWKLRGTKAYYYRVYREDGKVCSHYLPGELGRAWADMQQTRHRERKQFRDFKRTLIADDKPALELSIEVGRVADLAMIAAGYHKPRRQWRKIRDMSKLPATTAKAPANGAETKRLMDRAFRGDPTCYEEVLALLADGERGQALIHGIGSMANAALNRMIDALAGKDILLEQALHARQEHVRESTAGPNPSPMEAILAQAISFDSLVLYRHQVLIADLKGCNIPYVEFHTRMADSAHRRMCRSILTLARVRRCALPNLVQFNIAQGSPQQVNNG